ncbi:transposase [Pseudosulfitobacter pseudonitzschiae]|uniref:transposase n=1 Tax=Pseudosulfitobacter pseudonitzschiae TaxID=1402135 RepID=UPI001AF9B734|nr:transposase [Pseudosulfitobacter pseudonitzschiae]MBM1833058.1 transposase [Pseudosulfitobacter pseudonitzschiae]MBM1837926.1 transposase [Pseudosulfitobacter pseudonitzschiae]MBM1843187.1 transposase [Pseudosulfitobacter pseudonitzschiae]MBM1848053.1 transposase [Pseudosulfitobacter pseudonitzschiae]
MSSQNRFTDEFKRDAVAQVVERGYAVSEVAERLNDLLQWAQRFIHSVYETHSPLAERAMEIKATLRIENF